jgi:hypothetical protein
MIIGGICFILACPGERVFKKMQIKAPSPLESVVGVRQCMLLTKV